MSDTGASLRRKIASAGDLESVVRTMKAMAASNISQYENAVRSLEDYDRTVQLGLLACFRQRQSGALGRSKQQDPGTVCAVVFGSDQGLVGQFNDALAEFVLETLDPLPNRKMLWVVGERIQSRLADSPLNTSSRFILPNAIVEITPLVSQILLELESQRERGEIGQVYLFHNRPKPGALYESVSQRMLPLDDAWQRQLASRPWPTNNLPEVQQNGEQVSLAFIREYLFVSLFRSCAESLASENASRLAAMQRAEKNIGELLKTLGDDFHRLRQDSIDEELFDVVSDFEAYDH
ncbi:F0F1 ATP synthase subunit gamma [Pseudomonas sp. MWU12-2345]|uniref:F0F1 ATP synthase subunit gamma n=1 Tax=Pseudomonas sp. MWU12-2345 TaxID=2928689 RepID=UPI00200E1C55|nr:F0F1 ATP synthase subunit gamma [Pseudomonas sp. MWU12-2345]